MAGRGRIPAPIPQFNPREERQSLWRGETTRTLSRPTPHSPVQVTTPSEGAGRGVPRGPRSFPEAARARTHKDAAPSHPAPHITHPSWPFFSLRPGRAAPGQPAAVATCGGAGGSPRGSAPTTSNAPPWHRGADDQAQRMTPGKRSRASTTAAGRRAAPNHGGGRVMRPKARRVDVVEAIGVMRPQAWRVDVVRLRWSALHIRGRCVCAGEQ